jgi:hypothetical protein
MLGRSFGTVVSVVDVLFSSTPLVVHFATPEASTRWAKK